MTTHQDDEEIKDGLKDEWRNGCRLGHGSSLGKRQLIVVSSLFL